MMKIPIVVDATPYFVFPNPRGIGTYVLNLIKNLRTLVPLRASFKVERITRPGAIERYKELRRMCPVSVTIGKKKLFPSPKEFLFHGTDLFLLESSKYSVLTLHDLYYFKENLEDLSEDFVQKKRKRIEHLLLKVRPDAVITPSEFIKREVLELFPTLRGRIWTVYHGVSETYRPLPPPNVKAVLDRYGLKIGEYFLFVGYADGRKNMENILRAFLDVDYKLVIAGTPPDLLKEKYWVSQTLFSEKRLVSFPRLTEKELAAFYNGAIALVFPTNYEGFGLPVIEAMASGSPVIVSKIGVFKEVAQDAAFYVDEDDIGSIRDSLKRMREDPELRKILIEKGFKRAQTFSWEKCAKKTLEVYKRVLI